MKLFKQKKHQLTKPKTKKNSRTMEVLQKFGRGLMLPISVLPFAGILLGIGGAIGANVNTEAGVIAAGIFKGMSEVVFGNLPVLFTIAVVITFTGESGSAAFMGIIAYLVFNASQTVFIHLDANDAVVDIMWFHQGDGLTSLVGKNLGITSMQTSLFGGILVGIITAKLYNKFKYIQLPNPLSFFSGVRFLPIVLIPVSFVLALIFLIFWPWIGQGINWLGQQITKAPAGVDGLVYGIFTRALMPFGLHQIVIAVAYQTAFGGVLLWPELNNALTNANVDSAMINQIHDAFISFGKGSPISGDQNIWNFINSLPLNSINGTPIFAWFKDTLNVNAGRFTQDYPTYLGVCMGIGLALILTADKKSRKNTAAVIGSAMFVSFLTGITEPLEFTFLFITPVLYYAIYVPFSGLSYMFMELVNAHVGVGFSRGFIDLIVYGALPIAKGTNFWWAFIFALLEGGAIFPIFYFAIKKFDFPTPGRKGNEVVLITKKTYQEKKNSNSNNNQEKLDQRTTDVLNALGGRDNLVSVTACATRLRTVLKDANLVDKEKLKQLGASGTIVKGDNIQVIFGGEAVVLAEKINNSKQIKVD